VGDIFQAAAQTRPVGAVAGNHARARSARAPCFSYHRRIGHSATNCRRATQNRVAQVGLLPHDVPSHARRRSRPAAGRAGRSMASRSRSRPRADSGACPPAKVLLLERPPARAGRRPPWSPVAKSCSSQGPPARGFTRSAQGAQLGCQPDSSSHNRRGRRRARPFDQ